jgi:peptidoglycan/LPS O-acetylase OafA/YrhL
LSTPSDIRAQPETPAPSRANYKPGVEINTRNHSLDVLRGIAVLLVIVHHYAQADASLLHIGGFGVDLFFVLSGFLISGLLFSELRLNREISLERFLIRRGLKIYPAFYCFLFLTLPITFHLPLRNFLAEALFLQSYAPHIWQHTWSLSVEEMFYLALPLLIMLLAKIKGLNWIPAISAALIAGCLIGRVLLASPFHDFNQTHLRMDSLFAGVALRYLYQFHQLLFANWAPRVGWGILFLLPNGFAQFLSPTWRAVVLSSNLIGFSALLWWSQMHPFRSQAIAWIGRYSYSIYIWHMVVAILFWELWPASFWGCCADIAASILLGVGMALLIEAPVLTVRDRFFPSRSVPGARQG